MQAASEISARQVGAASWWDELPPAVTLGGPVLALQGMLKICALVFSGAVSMAKLNDLR